MGVVETDVGYILRCCAYISFFYTHPTCPMNTILARTLIASIIVAQGSANVLGGFIFKVSGTKTPAPNAAERSVYAEISESLNGTMYTAEEADLLERESSGGSDEAAETIYRNYSLPTLHLGKLPKGMVALKKSPLPQRRTVLKPPLPASEGLNFREETGSGSEKEEGDLWDLVEGLAPPTLPPNSKK